MKKLNSDYSINLKNNLAFCFANYKSNFTFLN